MTRLIRPWVAVFATTCCLTLTPASARAVAPPAVPEIILQVSDTTVSPFDSTYFLSVFLTNVLQSVAGIELSLVASTSGLFRLPDSLEIDTSFVCLNPPDCDLVDTLVDTVSLAPVQLGGSAIAGWDFVQARATSAYSFRLAAVADFPGGSTPAPIPPGGPRLLCRMVLVREASAAVLDTLTERTVTWAVAAGETSFSDPTGKSIGLQDSTLCLDPPDCTQLDTVFYYDPDINIYVNGSSTFGPSCVRGDVNSTQSINAADIIFLVNYVFKGGPAPGCSGLAGDVDCSGTVSSGDIVYLVNFVYKGGPVPCGF